VTLDDLATRVIRALDAAGIPYMLVGSVASSYHGEPRMTRDLNIVIDPDPDQLRTLIARLQGSGLYTDAAASQDALAQRTQFNAIDPETGWKADLIIRQERAFSREEFARREEAQLPMGTVAIARAEDVILAKLEWARSGQSDRQLRDAEGIATISADRLDLDYLDRWASELGVADLWQPIRPRAGRG
jgi:hypothetical protein